MSPSESACTISECTTKVVQSVFDCFACWELPRHAYLWCFISRSSCIQNVDEAAGHVLLELFTNSTNNGTVCIVFCQTGAVHQGEKLQPIMCNTCQTQTVAKIYSSRQTFKNSFGKNTSTLETWELILAPGSRSGLTASLNLLRPSSWVRSILSGDPSCLCSKWRTAYLFAPYLISYNTCVAELKEVGRMSSPSRTLANVLLPDDVLPTKKATRLGFHNWR